jgi:2-polyprenyl-6-hydroxyphenyl methylase/3-demethylubiquinone-9 3-methyltransferase
MDFSEPVEPWSARYKPIPDWDRMFRNGDWDYLDEPGEAARYALIAGYVHRRVGRTHVLDVGCGAGLLCRYLDRSRVSYSGIDLSPTAVARAGETFPEAEFSVSDIAEYEPAPSQLFDVIVFNEVLPHVENPLGSLHRYRSFLSASGMFVLSTYQNVNPRSNAAMFTGVLEATLAEGIFRLLTRCEVVTFEKGLKWRIDVIAPASPTDGD